MMTLNDFDNSVGSFVSENRKIHCEDQVIYYDDLVYDKTYVKVSGDRIMFIKISRIGRTDSGQVLFYSRLNEYLEVVEEDRTDYLTDLGLVGYEYRGHITWNTWNYIRRLRSTDYINEMYLNTASRLLMVPRKKMKYSRKSA